jgi:hypothetical protein
MHTNLVSQSERAGQFTRPSVSGARYFAREAAIFRMREAGRSTPSADDTRYLKAELARLLFMVEAADGGFLGLSDRALECRASDLALSCELVAGGLWRGAGIWPSSERRAA